MRNQTISKNIWRTGSSTHVYLGGNCKFLYEDSVDEIEKVLMEITENKVLYAEMKQVASEKGVDRFSYRKIAEKSIQ